MDRRITGVYAASSTPLDHNGNFNAPKLLAHCFDLLKRGCDGICLLGTNGEATSFSVAERGQILEALLNGGFPKSAIMLGSGAASVTDAITITQHAVRLGVTDFLILPPFFYKNVTDVALANYYSQIIDTVGSSDIRVILYNIPQFSGVRITAELITILQKRHPGIVVGVKDSSGDPQSAALFLKEKERIGLLVGAETLLKTTIQEGGAGCITGLANVDCEDLRTIYDAPTSEAAEKAHARLAKLMQMAGDLPVISGIKAMVAWQRKDDSWMNIRTPLVDMAKGDYSKIRAEYLSIIAEI